MYSTHNEGKSGAAERFIRTLKNKIFKHMTTISNNVHFDVLDDIVDKYNNTVHRTIKTKPIGVPSDSHAEYYVDSNEKDTNFKNGDHVRISKNKNYKYTSNILQIYSKLVKRSFVVNKIKNTVPRI